ncbi:MAG: hypothetical protein QM730_29300 [Anaerolineales bacterium]
MRRKLTYTFVLLVLVAAWGFAAAAPVEAQPPAQTTPQATVIVPTVVLSPIVNTVIVPGATQLVPVTGNNAPNSMLMLLFYGFLAILGIVLLIALFASANRSTTTTTYVRRDGPPPPPPDDEL